MKRRPIRRVSAKRQKENEVRREVVKLLPDYCEVRHAPEPCYGPLTAHEILPRARGGSITDLANLARVCAHHNTWLSQSVEGMRWGYANGFLRSAYEGEAG